MSFYQNGSRIIFHENRVVQETFPVGTYTIGFHPELGFYLEQTTALVPPKKLYGDCNSIASRVLDTYDHVERSMGVLFHGIKGSGKTITVKQISYLGLQKGISTLICNSCFKGASFNTFLSKIKQPIMVIFDEFEKMYHDVKEQPELLTLFDGTNENKHLYLLTANEYSEINTNFMNRPGRIRYNIEFDSLKEDAVVEYCDDHLNDKDHIESILRVRDCVRLTYDMLQALVDEMNFHNESAKEVLPYLNIEMNRWERSCFKVTLLQDGCPVNDAKLTYLSNSNSNEYETIHPLFLSREYVHFSLKGNHNESENDNECDLKLNIFSNGLVSATNGVFIFNTDVKSYQIRMQKSDTIHFMSGTYDLSRLL